LSRVDSRVIYLAMIFSAQSKLSFRTLIEVPKRLAQAVAQDHFLAMEWKTKRAPVHVSNILPTAFCSIHPLPYFHPRRFPKRQRNVDGLEKLHIQRN